MSGLGTTLLLGFALFVGQMGPPPTEPSPARLETKTSTKAAAEAPVGAATMTRPEPKPAPVSAKPSKPVDAKPAVVPPLPRPAPVSAAPPGGHEEMGPPSPVMTTPPPSRPSTESPVQTARRSLLSAIFFALLLLLGAQFMNTLRRGLLETGVLPRALSAAQVVLRLLAVFGILAALLERFPPELQPMLPWALVAVAAALGWSAREVLPDLLAGLVLQVERRLRRGQWVAAAGFRGEVLEIGFRSSRLREASGRILTLPNRRLITEPLEVELGAGPTIEVRVDVPVELSPARVHRALREATLLVPWIAPEAGIEIRRAEVLGTWIIHTRVIEGRYEEAFAGALREQVDEMWGSVDTSRPSLPPPPPPRKSPSSGNADV